MTPREIIARALHRADVEPRRFDPHWNVHEFDDLSDPAKVYWYRMADAVIDVLEGMEVTEAMEDAWRRHDWTALPCPKGVESPWRAMVGAMRDE